MSRRYRRAAAGTVFTPADITGLKLWYDFSDTATVTTTGSDITRVGDKSDTNNDLVILSADNPTVSTLNGLQCGLFDGVDDGMVTESAVSSNNVSYVMALKYESLPAGVKDIIVYGGAPFYELYLNGSTINTYVAANNNHTTTLDTNAHVVSVVISASDVKVYVDGVLTAANGSNTSTAAINVRLSVAHYSPALVNFSNVKLGEVIVVSGAISTSDRIKAQNYLKAKWGAP